MAKKIFPTHIQREHFLFILIWPESPFLMRCKIKKITRRDEQRFGRLEKIP